jgi:TRAP-type C4-dicarboxylate transport system permease small subunit
MIVYFILFLVHLFIASFSCLLVALGYDMAQRRVLSYRRLFLFTFLPGLVLFGIYRMLSLNSDELFFWVYWILTAGGLIAGFFFLRKSAKIRP